MAERDLLLSNIVKDVLGPRGGAVESFTPTMNPLNEYITGALAPLVDTVVPEIEHDDEFDADDGEGDEPDTEPPAAPPVPGTVSPSLDPRFSTIHRYIVHDPEPRFRTSDRGLCDVGTLPRRFVRGMGPEAGISHPASIARR